MAHAHHHDLTIPETMRSCRYHGVRKPLTVDVIPVPEIGENDALVKVTASGICRSDWHMWSGDQAWIGLNVPNPGTLGHEIGGVVVKTGSRVRHAEPGMRTTIPFHMACGTCPRCQKGQQNLCDNVAYPMLLVGSGGWQQYIRIPNADVNCIPLPEGVDELTAAALGCRYMTAWRAVTDRARVQGGETVAVIGCGGVGLAAVQIASALGTRTIAVDIDDEKLQKAKENGALATVNARGLDPAQTGAAIKQAAGGEGVDVAIDALGGQKTSLAGIFSLRKRGRLTQIGMTGRDEQGNVSLPMDIIVVMELQIIGSNGNPHSAFPQLLGLVASRKLNPKSLLSKEVSLDDVQSVLHDMDNYKTSGYVIITKF